MSATTIIAERDCEAFVMLYGVAQWLASAGIPDLRIPGLHGACPVITITPKRHLAASNCDHALAIAAERRRLNRLIVFHRFAQWLAARGIPDLRLPLVRSGPSPIVTIAPDHPLATDHRDDPLPIFAERCGGDRADMFQELAQRLAARGIPEPRTAKASDKITANIYAQSAHRFPGRSKASPKGLPVWYL